jgi:hypothetical protein
MFENVCLVKMTTVVRRIIVIKKARMAANFGLFSTLAWTIVSAVKSCTVTNSPTRV